MTIRNRQLALLVFTLIALALAPLAYILTTSDSPGPEGGNEGICMGTAECLEGEVTKIVDGDTLYIEGVKIRLALVDTPEAGDAGYYEAKAFVASICPEGSQATADQDDWQLEDQYGRMIAVVHCSGKNLNEELLDEGYGEVLTYYCDLSEFGNEAWAVEHGC